jgi:spermidine/putrescine transport system ATP-binding protein
VNAQSPVLELRNVSKTFGPNRVVDGVSLEIARGGMFSLVGPSGCGKTTSLRMVAGFETPDSGSVLLNGEPVNDLPPYRRNVSTVFQNYALFPHLTVQGNIEFGLRQRGAKAIPKLVSDVVELVQLAGKESRTPAQLSGGERQRVALARSLVLAPDVLLLDEPLSALDPLLRKQVRSELRALQRRVGITFLLVTHDQEEALSLSDQMAVMNRGRIEQIGTPREVYLKPRTRFVANFLGAMNWIGGIGIRPEATRLTREVPSIDTRSKAAIVRSATFLGNCIHVETQLLEAQQTVIAEVSRSMDGFVPGESVHVWWHAEDELELREP